MVKDLFDAQAAVDWAIAQLDHLVRQINAWIKTGPCIAVIRTDTETGQKVWEIQFTDALPRIINAETGAIVGSLRSSLDLLASVLAGRNNKPGRKDVYFPICDTRDRWDDGSKLCGKQKVKRLSDADRATIEKLQPYHGGHNGKLLSSLHHMDIARKHTRLLEFAARTPGVVISRASHGGNAVIIPFDDSYTLAIRPANLNYNVQVRVEVTLREAGVLDGRPVREALFELARCASSVIEQFEI